MAEALAAVGLAGLGDAKSSTYRFVQSSKAVKEIKYEKTVSQLNQPDGLPITPNSQNSQFFRVILGLLFLGLLLYLLIWRK